MIRYSEESTWDASNLRKIARTCTQLKDLRGVKLPIPPHCGLKTRRAALQSMAQLQHLRTLTASVWDDKELGIIAEMLQLRELHLELNVKCTLAGVLQLAKLKEQGALEELSLVNWGAGEISEADREELMARLPLNQRMTVLTYREGAQ